MKAQDLPSLIPSHVRITKKVTYEVLYTDEFLRDDKQMGECRFEEKQILIKTGESPTETFKTYLHEVLHAMAYENGFILTETQVGDIEESLFRILKLNKVFDNVKRTR